jgi:NAD(P)-dependent dehydrogenase (short-subunit alcohol dehydrogenase family)
VTQSPDNVPPIPDYARLLDGRVAVVTGGGDGIGGAISRLFAQHGATVEVAEIDPDRAAAIEAEGIEATVVDVRDAAATNAFAEDVLARHGRCDVLVSNVGDYRPLVRFEKSGPEDWAEMLAVNYTQHLAVIRAFIPSMRERRSGSIVTVHSVEGMRGYPGEPVYGSLKAATAKLTTDLAVRYGRDGIRVNGIGPDLTQTPQVDYLTGYEDHEHLWESWAPVGRLGWPEDQARVALFLASDMSSFVTGHNIPVDGGTKAGGGWFWSATEHRYVNRPKGI